MGKLRVAVIDGDAGYCRELCASLEQANIAATPFYALEGLPDHLRKNGARVMIVDLDTMPVDNNFFRTIKKHNPASISCVFPAAHTIRACKRPWDRISTPAWPNL
jgi:hypothetical protein